MSELAHQAIPIAVMFIFAFLLAPLVGFTMWAAFDGDRLRDLEDSAAGTHGIASSSEPAAPAAPVRQKSTPAPLQGRGVSAA